MMAAFGGGMKDAAWPVAETPASSNPARPNAIAPDFDMVWRPPVVLWPVAPAATMTLRADPFKSLAPRPTLSVNLLTTGSGP
jgi:hypothetical protein